MTPVLFLRQLWSGHRLPLATVGVLLLANLALAVAVQQYLVPTVTQKEQQLLLRQSELRGGPRDDSPVEQFRRGEKDLAVFYDMIPPHREFSGLITELQGLADETGLELTQVSYQHKQDDDKGLLSYQVGFSLAGQYRDLKQFIQALEQSPRLIILQQISLQTGGSGDAAEVRLQLSLQTFFKPEAS